VDRRLDDIADRHGAAAAGPREDLLTDGLLHGTTPGKR
jgi:hypothetical protein